MVLRSADLGRTMSRYLVDRIELHPRIDVRLQAQVTALHGDRSLSEVRVTSPDASEDLACSGLFSLIGADPSSDWLCSCAALDEHGFVLTDLSLTDAHLDASWQAAGRRPLPFETNRQGLFAVGDLRSGSMKRVASWLWCSPRYAQSTSTWPSSTEPTNGGSMEMLNITGLDHLGLKVTDMDRTLHFYHDVLGLEIMHTSGPHDNGDDPSRAARRLTESWTCSIVPTSSRQTATSPSAWTTCASTSHGALHESRAGLA